MGRRIRVSVANLVYQLVVVGNGECHRIAVLNPAALKKGFKRYQAVGGAAQLTSSGVSAVESCFGAREFEKDESTGHIDARFVVDESKLEAVFRRFELFSGSTNSFEHNPVDDIRHELCDRELPGIPPVLSLEEMLAVKAIYHSVVRQPAPKTGLGTSLRSRSDVPTRRLFRLYNLWAPPAVAEKIIRSPAIRTLTDAELSTTAGGSRKGSTHDGVELADNLF